MAVTFPGTEISGGDESLFPTLVGWGERCGGPSVHRTSDIFQVWMGQVQLFRSKWDQRCVNCDIDDADTVLGATRSCRGLEDGE